MNCRYDKPKRQPYCMTLPLAAILNDNVEADWHPPGGRETIAILGEFLTLICER